MRLIVITPERPHQHEAELIAAMLRRGIDRVHLRHPAASEGELRNIIASVPLELRGRLTLHDHFRLCSEFPQLGVNLNTRNPHAPAGIHGPLSRSCHTVEETRLEADYVLLSPIFPSISKPGYSGEFTDEDLSALPPGKVVALGGVDCERLALLKRYPFVGAAFLGSVWNENSNRATVLENVAKIIEKNI